ncbi:hypothetical protein FIBSPDRAFT_871273 [Athelia psychrophila]|uniref:Uncharacterized protein n=1 Tax=Athelia psychrophila TaxID=1759441 RepID=A0A166AG40_9AGAM|nr:hypothetical protein FIBSPDRAFT_871273 [Fibularhizoctonia sp. CBS 109695]
MAQYALLITLWLLAGLSPPTESTNSTGSARHPSFALSPLRGEKHASSPGCYLLQVLVIWR